MIASSTRFPDASLHRHVLNDARSTCDVPAIGLCPRAAFRPLFCTSSGRLESACRAMISPELVTYSIEQAGSVPRVTLVEAGRRSGVGVCRSGRIAPPLEHDDGKGV